MGSFLETFYDPVRATHLAVSSFIDSKVTLLAEPAFLHITIFSHIIINARLNWLGWEGAPLSPDNSSPYKPSHGKVDREQSLFFLRFSEGSARARER